MDGRSSGDIPSGQGQIETRLGDGCPMLPKKAAMKIIQELEGGAVEVMTMKKDPMMKWMNTA